MSEQEKRDEVIKVFGNNLRVRVSGICIVDSKILLIKHLHIGKGEYLWAPPGGGLKFGEGVTESLKREFLEETGLEIEVVRFLFVREFLEPPLHAIELFFEIKALNGVLQKGFDPEMPDNRQIISKVVFLSIQELREENPLNLHAILRNCNNFEILLQTNGFVEQKV